MVHGVKMFLEDVCGKRLQQEESTHNSTSSHHIPLACVSVRQEAELCLETDMPKMIAEVSFIPGCYCCNVNVEITAKLYRLL